MRLKIGIKIKKLGFYLNLFQFLGEIKDRGEKEKDFLFLAHIPFIVEEEKMEG